MIARFGLATCAALAAAAALAPAAQAQDLRLRYGDLDLSQPGQAQVLDQRIDAAARDWCSHEEVTGSRMTPASCVPETKAQVVASLPARVRDALQAGRGASATASLGTATKGS